MKQVSNLPHMIAAMAQRDRTDYLDALMDLCDAAPTEGDDRLAVYFETQLHAEQTAAAKRGERAAFDRAKNRVRAAAHFRAQICTALALTQTGDTERRAA